MSKLKKAVRRIGKVLPPGVRSDLKRALRRVRPAKSQTAGRSVSKASQRGRRAVQRFPLDHLNLANPVAAASGKGMQVRVAGRAAAGTTIVPDASIRLGRAMFGHLTAVRTPQGGRTIAGIFANDLANAFEQAGHDVHSFAPGLSEAYAAAADVLVIDLAGFTGVWAGALDPSGVSLVREVMGAVEAARVRGVTCWLVVRGQELHKHGGIMMQNSSLLEHLFPGQASAEQPHFTENPGDVPAGIVDIIRSLGVAV